MTAPSWGRVKELLYEAVALNPQSRVKFLDEVCASDAELRAELEALLAVGDGLSAEFLEAPSPDKPGADGDGFDAVGLAAGQLFAQRFQLIRRLGEGGMGQVWLAEQTAPVRRPVALKLIRAGMYDETVVQRFQAERQSLAIMDHPAIAKVFDAGITPQGQPYFVMEYVPGLTITEYCDQKRLKIRERLELFIHACEGVQHAHQKAVVHRDLKPANILVIEIDGKPVPRIIDFGLAKATSPHPTDDTLHTRFGLLLGTPGYMSPEQVNPNIRDIDTRTDVYSLGVILYVLLTGMQPFEMKGRQRPSLEEWLRRLREEEPRRPSSKLSADLETSAMSAAARSTEPKQLVGLLRGDLDWITMKAIERDRERRYGTPAELAADLRRYLHDEPVVARPASSVYQLRKFIRRHRIAAMVIGMMTVLAIVASGTGLIAVRQKHEAEYQAARALEAQGRLLTQVAAQRLKDFDAAGAQGIILEVLANSAFARTPAAISVFQDIRASDLQRGVLSGHRGTVESAAYSPDGTRIVTASGDNTARIWDAHTGAELGVLHGHGDRVNSAAYSPDGTRIVTASDDKTARLWDARTGAQLVLLAGHLKDVNSAAYSPDGMRIVTASDDKTARLWDARTGVSLAILSGHGDQVIAATFSVDGSQIVTASGDKTARLWDARTGAQLIVLSGHGSFVNSAFFSPDGTHIVTASADKTARIWDARTGAQLAVLFGHSHAVSAARYSPDGTHIVTASFDKTARIWDARTGAELAVLFGHRDSVHTAAYSPDGRRIVTASGDKTARLWDTRIGAQLTVLSGHDDIVYSAAYSPDGARIVTASADETARIWDARGGAQLAVLSSHGGLVYGAAYSPDNTHVVIGLQDSTARIWDARNDSEVAMLSGHGALVLCAAYSPDGTRIVTGSNDFTARIWDARSGAALTVLRGHSRSIPSAHYSPDGTHIVTGSNDSTARIWDARTGAQLSVLAGHSDRVHSAAYSPDGTRIVTASFDKTARIWDARTGAPLGILAGHGDIVRSAAYSPDGTQIVTASNDKTARIWDVRTGVQLRVLAGHRDSVIFAAYSPDGSYIVTASSDHTARIWAARESERLEDQILWDSSAQTDPLSEVDRAQLGLPRDPRARYWPTPGSACDRAAAAVYDPDRLTPGVLAENVAGDIAYSACSAEIGNPRHAARADYQMGRTLVAKGDANGGRQQFEIAVRRGYRAARVDLADLLLDASAGKPDPGRAASLYEQAWDGGVLIAAFKLGRLLENRVQPANTAAGAFETDTPKAWSWYQKGADAGEPHALARFAERNENDALTTADPAKRHAQLLQAFEQYAAAVEGAHDEGWPDDAWRHWQYRRASLARLLAVEGMMQQVADAYAAVLDQRSAPPTPP